MKIRFCGAVDSVTGSCHMISTSRHTVLLDCGMYQGGRELEARNEAPFPFDPRDIECVLLSHAHIDHCGRLPLLVKRGFTGPIYCTDATADLLRIMLPDCAHIQQQDTERANRKAMRRGDAPKEPTYTMADVDKTLRQVRPVLYDQLFPINDQMHAVFNEAGHILGSAITELWTQEDEGTVKLVFTGDIGMPHRPILRDPKKIKKADVVIMESTYGDRLHTPNPDSVAELIHIICQTVTRGGNVIIPAFAVGRTQELIYSLNRFYESSQPPLHDILDSVDVYIDSPMAISTTQVFRRNAQVFDEETRAYILSGDNPLDFKNLRFSRTADDSRALNMDERPKVIIAASGMCDAGPHPPPSQAQPLERKGQRRLCRLSGGGNARPRAARRRKERDAVRRENRRSRADSSAGGLFRPCGCGRPDGLGPRPSAAAARAVPGARGGRRQGSAGGPYPARTRILVPGHPEGYRGRNRRAGAHDARGACPRHARRRQCI